MVYSCFERAAPPASIATSAGWSTGAFDYDGGGNIKRMGSQDFQYDRLSRLTLGEAATGGLEAITYDSFGNIQSMNTGGVFQPTPTSATHNRLTLTGTTYDPAGNLTRLSMGGETFEYEYDGLSMMRSLVSNTDQAKVFLYPCLLSWADDERFAIFECVSGFGPSTCASGEQRTLWYMRDLDGKVLRSWELQVEGQHWTWLEDNIFRAGQPLATVTHDGNGNSTVHHLHLDHLGTPRQITDSTGTQLALHHYYPFGQEATDPAQDPVRLKYTGHERDQNGNSKGMLDYMHARYESSMVGRFLSVDPIGGNPQAAQSWNRYSYVLGNPANLVDPTGLVTTCVNGDDGRIICTEDEPVDVVGTDPNRDVNSLTGLEGLGILQQGRLQLDRVAQGILARFKGSRDKAIGARFEGSQFCTQFESGAERCGPIKIAMMPMGPGGFGGSIRTLQRGGSLMRQSTANALNKSTGRNLQRREWGRALERLKKENGKPSGWHEGRILENGDVTDHAGRLLDNLLDFLF